MEYPGTMRRALPVLLLFVLLAILAVAWFLRPADVEEGDGDAMGGSAPGSGSPPPVAVLPPGASEPHLEGRSDARPPPRVEGPFRRWAPTVAPRPAPKFRIHGSVRDARGKPLHGVTVYQLSHEAPHGTGWLRERAETDEHGAFAFLGHPPAGTWISARAPGRRTAFADGADVGPGGEVHLVLEEAPPLVVRLVDAEGEPVSYGEVRAVPVTRRGPDCPFPGPESSVPEQLEMTGSDGTATFRFEIRVPVVILPEVESMVTRPRELRAFDAEGTFTFEVLSAGGLELKAVDEGGAPIRESLWVSVLDPDTGTELASYRSSEKDGALEVEPSLPPGPYYLDVSALGYEPAVLPDVVLPVGPETVKRTVTLQPLGEGAVLRILLSSPPASGRPSVPPSTTGGRRGGPLRVFLRRSDAGWQALGWIHRVDFRLDPVSSAVTLDLRPGTYEVVLCRPRDESVAALGPLVLGAGQTVEKRARSSPGVSFALYDVLPPDLTVRAVRIVAPGRGIFPVVGTWFRASSILDAGDLVETIARPGSKARSTAGGGALLGPYPGAHVVLEVDDWSGRTHRLSVGR